MPTKIFKAIRYDIQRNQYNIKHIVSNKHSEPFIGMSKQNLRRTGGLDVYFLLSFLDF